MTIVTMFWFQNRKVLLIPAHKLMIVVSSKKVCKKEVQTPNLVMEPVTCSLDIINNMDDFARYIENGFKMSASEKSNVIAKKWIPEDFVFPKDHNKLCFKPLWCKTYKWLAYSKSCNGVYCVTCVLFGKEISQLNVAKLSAFYKEHMIGSMEFKGLRDMHQVQYIKMLMLIWCTSKILKYIIKMSRLISS